MKEWEYGKEIGDEMKGSSLKFRHADHVWGTHEKYRTIDGMGAFDVVILSNESLSLHEFPLGMVQSLIFVYTINERPILCFEKSSLPRGPMAVTQLWITDSNSLDSPSSINHC
jgi:hypothetical protein